MGPGNIILIALVVLVVIFIMLGIKIVPQATVMIIERLGRFNRQAESGLHFVIPLIDKPRMFYSNYGPRSRIDLREQVMDFEPQPVITRDNVTMQVDSVIYYRIIEPKKAIYEVEYLPTAIRQLAITNMRNVMGELDLDESLTSRETINSKLQSVLDTATDVWGVKITRVELKNINPPAEIEHAMAKQMKAERERRAIVTEAEGIKAAQILRAQGQRDSDIAAAEGERQAKILRAEGDAQAIQKVREAEARAYKVVFEAIKDANVDDKVIAIQYLESLKAIADGDANKVFLPFEASGILSAVAGIADAAKGK